MKVFFPLICTLLLLSGARPQPGAAPGDSLGAEAEQHSAPSDSIHLEKIDPAQAWKTWKELSRAIRLRPLDGPDDILEKAEIIEDRLDDLGEARQELRTEAQEWEDRRQALELQIEVLNDLAQVQRGGDLQLQQRLHTLREDLGKAARRLGVLKGSLKELDKELYRLNGLVKEYNHKAAELRRREEENR